MGFSLVSVQYPGGESLPKIVSLIVSDPRGPETQARLATRPRCFRAIPSEDYMHLLASAGPWGSMGVGHTS